MFFAEAVLDGDLGVTPGEEVHVGGLVLLLDDDVLRPVELDLQALNDEPDRASRLIFIVLFSL